MTGGVVHLAFTSPKVADDFGAMLACVACRNKTFTFVIDQPDGGFPLLRCAACGGHLGRMGWVHDDDPLIAGLAK